MRTQRRFRVNKDDTVKAQLYNDKGKLLSTLYDSGFTSIKQVEAALLNKVPYYSGKKLNMGIFNIDKDIYKRFTITVKN